MRGASGQRVWLLRGKIFQLRGSACATRKIAARKIRAACFARHENSLHRRGGSIENSCFVGLWSPRFTSSKKRGIDTQIELHYTYLNHHLDE